MDYEVRNIRGDLRTLASEQRTEIHALCKQIERLVNELQGLRNDLRYRHESKETYSFVFWMVICSAVMSSLLFGSIVSNVKEKRLEKNENRAEVVAPSRQSE